MGKIEPIFNIIGKYFDITEGELNLSAGRDVREFSET